MKKTIYIIIAVIFIASLLGSIMYSPEKKPPVLEHITTIAVPSYSWQDYSDRKATENEDNTKISFSDDDSCLATWPGDTLYVYETESGKLVRSISGVKMEEPLPTSYEGRYIYLACFLPYFYTRKYLPLVPVAIPDGFTELKGHIKKASSYIKMIRQFTGPYKKGKKTLDDELIGFVDEGTNCYRVIYDDDRQHDPGNTTLDILDTQGNRIKEWKLKKNFRPRVFTYHSVTNDICIERGDTFYLTNFHHLEVIHALPCPTFPGEWVASAAEPVFSRDGTLLSLRFYRRTGNWEVAIPGTYLVHLLIDVKTGEIVAEQRLKTRSNIFLGNRYCAIVPDGQTIEIYRINLP